MDLGNAEKKLRQLDMMFQTKIDKLKPDMKELIAMEQDHAFKKWQLMIDYKLIKIEGWIPVN